jgi:hypothetical protein
MDGRHTNGADDGAAALALAALAWTIGEPARAERLLALTGLTPDGLRARLGEPAMLAALLGHLEAHEPDLTACAEALGIAPADLVAARRSLDGSFGG